MTKLQAATAAIGTQFGIAPMDIFIHSLHSSGAMALHFTNIDSDCILLLAATGDPMRRLFATYMRAGLYHL